MDRSDFTTHVVVAVSCFLATLPALVSPPQGPKDIYKVLFVLGPIAMVSLAVYGRRKEMAAGGAHTGGRPRVGAGRLLDATNKESEIAEERSPGTSGAGPNGSSHAEGTAEASSRGGDA
jgi:hypothetical protein